MARPGTPRPEPVAAGAHKGTADDFDPVAWCYDWLPVPTHPKRLAPRLAKTQGPVVDLGGGTGRFTTRIFDPAHQRVLLMDPAHKMLQKSRRKRRRVEAVQAVGESLPLPERSIGAIVITEAFHHFAQGQTQVLQEAARVLRDDGLLVIEEPDPTRLLGLLMSTGEHLQRMTSVFHPPDQLQTLLQARFHHVTTERTGLFTYVAEATTPRRTQ